MPNCSSCGNPIPEGQGSSCSMCYGDPFWGRDGYYLAYLEEEERAAQERAEAAVHERRSGDRGGQGAAGEHGLHGRFAHAGPDAAR